MNFRQKHFLKSHSTYRTDHVVSEAANARPVFERSVNQLQIMVVNHISCVSCNERATFEQFSSSVRILFDLLLWVRALAFVSEFCKILLVLCVVCWCWLLFSELLFAFHSNLNCNREQVHGFVRANNGSVVPWAAVCLVFAAVETVCECLCFGLMKSACWQKQVHSIKNKIKKEEKTYCAMAIIAIVAMIGIIILWFVSNCLSECSNFVIESPSLASSCVAKSFVLTRSFRHSVLMHIPLCQFGSAERTHSVKLADLMGRFLNEI